MMLFLMHPKSVTRYLIRRTNPHPSTDYRKKHYTASLALRINLICSVQDQANGEILHQLFSKISVMELKFKILQGKDQPIVINNYMKTKFLVKRFSTQVV